MFRSMKDKLDAQHSGMQSKHRRSDARKAVEIKHVDLTYLDAKPFARGADGKLFRVRYEGDVMAAKEIDTSTLPAVLEALRPFLECETCAKVWHNYGFDRHVLWNHDIDVRGFGGDTMHMARLWDASRKAVTAGGEKGGYSLEALTAELVGRRKAPMKELFGVPVLKKDGKMALT